MPSAELRGAAERNADIIRMAQRLERQLEAHGALGRGLGEYARSLRGTLPDEVLHDVMKVNRVRNDFVHRDIDLPLSERDRASLAASYERASRYLDSRREGGEDAAPRRRVSWSAVALAAAAVALLVWLALTQGPV